MVLKTGVAGHASGQSGIVTVPSNYVIPISYTICYIAIVNTTLHGENCSVDMSVFMDQLRDMKYLANFGLYFDTFFENILLM